MDDADRIRELETENARLRARIAELEAERTDQVAKTEVFQRQARVLETQRNNIIGHMLSIR